ncbi:MAG: DUF91 domain-containing protein [Thaumarchaeota archaeon]|nr:DUF91 domain-containing protein [Nitrososphaerota archaeon]
MLETVSLQVEGGAVAVAAIVAVIVAVIVSIVFLGIQRRTSRIDPKIQYDVSRMQKDLQNVYTDLTNLKTGIPHTNEVNLVQENVKKLCGDFTELKTTIEDQMNKFRLGTTEDLTKTRDEMIKTATEKLTNFANDHLIENSITREEFENLKSHIEKVLGADEVAERMEVLSAIFDSTQINTLNWQCRLIKLLNGGLAPDAEEDLIISQGIPRSSYEKFLKKLTKFGISTQKQISAYYLTPDYEWIYSYVEKPDWLRNRLENTVKKENDYQQYIKNHLNLVEEGLLLEESEYELATGRIDFICRDPNGKTVGLELKYPAAITTVKRQIAGYRQDYEEKTGRTDSRFILVAPHIPENLKQLLVDDGLEYKEIEF